MKAEFDQWFEDTFDEKNIDEESLYSIAKKAWDAALNNSYVNVCIYQEYLKKISI